MNCLDLLVPVRLNFPLLIKFSVFIGLLLLLFIRLLFLFFVFLGLFLLPLLLLFLSQVGPVLHGILLIKQR